MRAVRPSEPADKNRFQMQVSRQRSTIKDAGSNIEYRISVSIDKPLRVRLLSVTLLITDHKPAIGLYTCRQVQHTPDSSVSGSIVLYPM